MNKKANKKIWIAITILLIVIVSVVAVPIWKRDINTIKSYWDGTK